MFEYAIEDYLELKACLDKRRTKSLKQFLFSQEPEGFSLSAVEGFLVAGHLVLIQPGDPDCVDNLVFLSPNDGTIRVKTLSV